MKKRIIPAKTLTGIILIIVLIMLWLFQIQQGMVIALDLKEKKSVLHETSLVSTAAEAEYIELSTTKTTIYLKNTDLVQETQPVFVRRTHRFGFLSESSN